MGLIRLNLLEEARSEAISHLMSPKNNLPCYHPSGGTVWRTRGDQSCIRSETPHVICTTAKAQLTRRIQPLKIKYKTRGTKMKNKQTSHLQRGNVALLEGLKCADLHQIIYDNYDYCYLCCVSCKHQVKFIRSRDKSITLQKHTSEKQMDPERPAITSSRRPHVLTQRGSTDPHTTSEVHEVLLMLLN